jgi:hypothetical protein
MPFCLQYLANFLSKAAAWQQPHLSELAHDTSEA